MNENYKQFKSEYLKDIKFIDNGYEKTEMKEDCIKYIDYLQNNWNELKKWLEKQLGKGFSENQIYIDVIYKMQELEQWKDE